ncbi:MAG: chitinase [Gammaproteobacteria bacterium]|nr:chitinase [Gammaproteobacteria bacterium]
MQNLIKSFLVTIVTTGLIPFTLSAHAEAINFSPYADLTINTHWDSQYQDMEPMDLAAMSQSSGVKNYHLAFITDAGNCNPAWGAQSSYSVNAGWGSHVLDKMRANSIGYIVSFGGASGNDVSMACSESQLITLFEQVIKTYQPQGLDFDIENGTANVVNLLNALKQIQNTHPNLKMSFTLPVLPEGLTASGQEIVKQVKTSGIHYSVNIMAMDYGPAYVNDMGQYAIQASTQLFTFLKGLYPTKSDSDLWKMVEVTPMIGVNDVNVEQFTLTSVDTLKNFARQNNLGALSMWSVSRDNPCTDQWASPICSGHSLQSKPYEFSQRFMQ